MGEKSKEKTQIEVASVTLLFSAELIILPAGHSKLFNIQPQLDKSGERNQSTADQLTPEL